MKDGEGGAAIVSRLERVELGTDDDGDPITSCIIVESEAAPTGPKLTGSTKLAYETLIDLAKQPDSPPADANVPPDIPIVSAIRWREHFYAAMEGKPDTKRKALVRAMGKLQELELVGLWSTWAWLPDKPDIAKK
jgi:hypothetical protein